MSLNDTSEQNREEALGRIWQEPFSTMPEHPTSFAAAHIDFRREVIYFIVVDRFNNGNPNNLYHDSELNDPSHQDWDKYWGGDLQGILDKLDYLQETGVTALWLTPLFEQVEGLEDDKKRAPIHGYWARDFKRIHGRWLNDPSEASLFRCKDTLFDRLLAEVHRRGMKFVLDVVCNHSSPPTDDGKGKLYDDGVLIADYANDPDGWYHHYGDITNWEDEWQLQNQDVGGLATFNENNIRYRRYIKEAIRLWLERGVDALRIDTLKHMPPWFWQEFVADLRTCRPDVFIFGEWINSHPDDERSVAYANEDGITILDFGLCQAIRDCLAEGKKGGFKRVQEILDKDGNYLSATELVTFIENHDMPRFQTLNSDIQVFHQALVLLMTLRGIPCLYYGCEQYLYSNEGDGNDPYNRPMMEKWEPTEARKLIAKLSEERRCNPALQWSGVWPVAVSKDVYVFLRRYRDSRCLVIVNKGRTQELDLNEVDMPDGNYTCLLTGKELSLKDGRATVSVQSMESLVFSIRGHFCQATTVIHVQINGVPSKPGQRVAVQGDASELGEWDLEKMQYLEPINANTWAGELMFNESAGRPITYKYVIVPSGSTEEAVRENLAPRRCDVPPQGTFIWRDRWER